MKPSGKAPRTGAIVGTLLLCLLLVACSAASRYRVLSFVFDGVPPPEGVEPRPEPNPYADKGRSAFAEGLQQIRAQNPRKPRPQQVILSVHRPVAERKCIQCHDASGVGDIAHDASLCDRCHRDQRQREGWNHGPVNLGTCIPCHLPHQSVNPHLLSAPVGELCTGCHTTLRTQSTEDYHRDPEFASCIDCHDPHRMY